MVPTWRSPSSSLPVSGAAAVRYIFIISDKNRRPMLAKVSFTPESGRAFVATSIRLGDDNGCARDRRDERRHALFGEQACAGDDQRLRSTAAGLRVRSNRS